MRLGDAINSRRRPTARDLAKYVDRLQPVLSRLDLPRKRGATAVDHAGARFNFSLDLSLGDALFGFAKSNSLTPFIVVLAAYVFVLASHAGARSVCVTVPLRARDRPELERLIGTFTNNVFVVVDLPPNATFLELCLEVRDAVFDGFARVATPVEAILQRIDADLARTSLFQIGFSHQNVSSRVVDWGAVSVEPGPVTDFHTSHADINFWLLEYRHALVGAIDYRSKSFDRWQIEAIYEQVCETLRWGTTSPGRALHLRHLWSDSALRAVERWHEGPQLASAGERLKARIGDSEQPALRVTTLTDLRAMFDRECSRLRSSMSAIRASAMRKARWPERSVFSLRSMVAST